MEKRLTPAIDGVNSISEIVSLTLSGMEQTILLRGHDKRKPILLVLHGGPGMAGIGILPAFQEKIEEHFVVVNWDQRGSGLSFSEKLSKTDLTIDEYVNDIIELTIYLTERFNDQKIFLLGMSWGSLIGMYATQKAPHLFHAYIGAGQMSDQMKGGVVAYQFALKNSQERLVEEAIKELQALGEPPYENPMDGLMICNKWIDEFGGITRDLDLDQLIQQGLQSSPTYLEEDLIRFQKGYELSSSLVPEITTSNLIKDIPEVKVPVYFFLGRYDQITPSRVTEEFLYHLKAPDKRAVWFDQSAHFMVFEEADRFNDEIIRVQETVLVK